ncbi:DNA-binding protein [Candidatus Geothermarchaeota archaeon]|nr:MAG: DNA-binding protein [Candidatus Geothermarchaeota archaeon]
MSEAYDEELEMIKRRKLLELQRRLQEEERIRREREAIEIQRQEILRRILTPKARERLNNLKLVRPDVARFVEDQLIALVQSGRVKPPITDEVVKAILQQVYEQTHRDIKIRIIRR